MNIPPREQPTAEEAKRRLMGTPVWRPYDDLERTVRRHVWPGAFAAVAAGMVLAMLPRPRRKVVHETRLRGGGGAGSGVIGAMLPIGLAVAREFLRQRQHAGGRGAGGDAGASAGAAPRHEDAAV